jgi:hypothetical protein
MRSNPPNVSPEGGLEGPGRQGERGMQSLGGLLRFARHDGQECRGRVAARGRSTRLAAALLLALASPALAGGPPPADDDWPCPQRRTGAISRAAIWSGPEAQGRWDDDRQAAALARKLASRRTPVEEAGPLIDAFAREAGADKDKRLTLLFEGTLDLINGERDKVMSAITRYARGQKALAAKVREDADKVADAQEKQGSGQDITAPDELEKAHPELKWDKRIFDDRAQALTYVCESPVVLEKRAFAIARAIEQKL